MLTQNFMQEKPQNVSSEVMEGFKMIHKVINQSGLSKRCKNLDKRRNKEYWTLPEEMAARSFEVYLKSKLEEKNIRNDYLVNFRTDESWAKATENGFKMENTYPYPTAAELTKKYSSESVEKLIQELSPAGRKNKNYGREILQEVRSCWR